MYSTMLMEKPSINNPEMNYISMPILQMRLREIKQVC